eukprot:g7890.t1
MTEGQTSLELVVSAFERFYDRTTKKFRGKTVGERNSQRRCLYNALDGCTSAELAQLQKTYGFEDTIKFLKCESYKRYNPLFHVYAALRGALMIAVFFVGLIPLSALSLLTRICVNPLLKHVLGWPEQKMPCYRFFAPFIAEGLASLCGAEVVVTGKENLEKVKSDNPSEYIGMFSHQANLDPFVVMKAVASDVSFLWTYKHSLLYFPGFCVLAYSLKQEGGRMNRTNRGSAIKTCDRLAKSELPPMCAPEGTRSKSGLILPELKKGVFYVRTDRKAKILPIVVNGTYELWAPGSFLPTLGRY